MLARPTNPPVPTDPHPPRASVNGLFKAATRPSTASPLVFLLLLLCAGAAVAAPTALPADLRMIQDLARGDAEAAAADFSPALSAQLDAKRLDAVWQSLTASLGALAGMTAVERIERGEFTIRVLRLEFERGRLDAQISRDADEIVHGLFFRPAAVPADPPPDPDAFREEKVGTGAEGWPLPATLTLPAGDGPFPAVLLVHGSGPNDRDLSVGALRPFRDLAHGLARHGIASLRYEKRTREHAARVAAETPDITLEEEVVADALAGLRSLASHSAIDPQRRFLLGISLGAVVAPRIAQRAIAEDCAGDSHAAGCGLAGVLMLAPSARPLHRIVPAQVRYIAMLDGEISEAEQGAIARAERLQAEVERALAGENVDLAWTGAGASYWRDLHAYDALATAAALDRPMLLLQGERDYQVTVADDFVLWQRALAAHPQAAVHVLPGLNHLFVAGSGPSGPSEYLREGHVDDSVITLIAEWIVAAGGETP